MEEEQQQNTPSFEQLESYTFLEFSVKPSLLSIYIDQLIRLDKVAKVEAIQSGYYDHIVSLVQRNQKGELLFEQSLQNKKIYSLLKLFLIVVTKSKFTARTLVEYNYDQEIVHYCLCQSNSTYPEKQLLAIKEAYDLKQLLFYHENNGVKEEEIQELKQLIMSKIEQSFIHFGVNIFTYEVVFLGISLLFILDQFSSIKQVIDQYNLCNVSIQFEKDKFYFNQDKLKIIRKLTDETVLSPITQASDQEFQGQKLKKIQFSEEIDFDKKHSEKKKSSQVLSNSDQLVLQLNQDNIHQMANVSPISIAHYLAYLLDDSIKFFNQDTFNLFKMYLPYSQKLQDYPYLVKIDQIKSYQKNDLTIMRSIFEQYIPTNIEMLIQPQIVKLLIITMIEKADQIGRSLDREQQYTVSQYIQSRIHFESQKINNFNNPDINSLANYVLHRKDQLQTQNELKVWISNILILLYILFGQVQLTHQKIQKQVHKDLDKDSYIYLEQLLKNINLTFERLIQENLEDVLRDFIEGISVRYYLDIIEAILIKDLDKKDPWMQNYQFNTLLTFLRINCPEFLINIKQKLRNFLLKLAFQREKQLISLTIRQIQNPQEQFEFKYSKLYKKQISFYHKQSLPFITIKKTLNYFLGYLTVVSVSKRQYLAEQSIITILFKSLYDLNKDIINHNSIVGSLIVSQFIDEKSLIKPYIDKIIESKSLYLLPEEIELLMDHNLITKLARVMKLNSDERILGLLIQRIQSEDTYSSLDDQIKQNIKERYFNFYLQFLRSKIF